MARVKRGIISMKRRRNILRRTKGYKFRRKTHERAAKEALLHALSYAYRDRRKRKSEMRSLWNLRLNAAARLHGTTYSRLIASLKKEKIAINRKMLAELAVREPNIFEAILKETALVSK